MTRRFQIYLAPPGAGPEYHHSGLENGFAPPHTLTNYALAQSAFILPHPSQPGSAAGASVGAENYAALTPTTSSEQGPKR